MVFSSSIFLFYFLPVFLLLYFLADKKYKNYVALGGSIIFFIWGAPLFIFVVIGSVIINFLFGIYIHRLKGKSSKILLICGVLLNVCILIFFQYIGFLTENINAIFGTAVIGEMKWMKVVIPLGISFITFHQISYLIDVYRDVKPPMTKIGNFALFILFFPQLISGPIVRLNEISDQIDERSHQHTIDDKLLGFVRFFIGLAKKVLIANVLGLEVDRIFALTEAELTTPLAWIGILAYTFQIYFDFAGYSDMAIGLARIMGFKFPENFKSPYVSQNITEFWRRWHITLSSWLRDYLFMPMSVSMRNKGKAGLIISIMVTFVICGLWHKPGWTFIIWGAYHGVLLVADRLFLLKILKKIGKVPAIIITFFLTVLGWVFFRADNISHAGTFFKKMFSIDFRSAEWGINADFWTIFGVAVIFSFLTVFKFGGRIEVAVFEKPYNTRTLLVLGTISIILFIISVGSITSSGFSPFIYFRF